MIETTEWDTAWFRTLPPAYKCLWRYIHAKCDNAGVWNVDFDLAKVYIGSEVTENEAIGYFADKFEVIAPDKWWFFAHPTFQCNKWPLSEKSGPHAHIIKLLKEHKLTERLNNKMAEAEQPF